MLAYLHVKNIALIEELEIDFDHGLNILTGETGAGKSIILGSVNYVLGAKVKKDFIRTGAKEAFVECVFDILNNKQDLLEVQEILKECGIEYDEQGVIISRKTSLNGRSVFRVNGEVVRLDVIRSLATLLIDIHSQHEHQSLLNKSRQLELLDRYAGKKMITLLADYTQKFRELQKLKQSINEELLDDDKRRREIAFIEFEVNEIIEASLDLGEDEKLQKVYDKLSHSRIIMEKLSVISNEFYGGGDISNLIGNSLGELDKLIQYDLELKPVVDSLIQIEDLIGTLKRDMNRYLETIDEFEEDLYMAEQRLDLINQIKLKYGDTIESVFDYLKEKEDEHKALVDFELTLAETKRKIKELDVNLLDLANKIHVLRVEKASKLSVLITESLQDLNLENAEFEVMVLKDENFTLKGLDKVVFLISTNKGESLKPLKDVASGGELSRVMLAIKSVLASVDGVDTLVFDEIDSGISGQTAQKVAEKMARLSKERQMISITHLPQIASMAEQHYLIHKETENEITRTYVDPLNEEESIVEIARMLSGAVTSDIVLANAREMKKYAKSL